MVVVVGGIVVVVAGIVVVVEVVEVVVVEVVVVVGVVVVVVPPPPSPGSSIAKTVGIKSIVSNKKKASFLIFHTPLPFKKRKNLNIQLIFLSSLKY